jgi:hypothetical protein
MTCVAIVDEQGRLVLAQESVRKLGLRPGLEIAIEIAPSKHKPCPDAEGIAAAFAAIREGAPAFQRRLRTDGYASVDDYLADIRPAW